MLTHLGFQAVPTASATAVLAGAAQKGHSAANLGGSRDIRATASLEHCQ
jgi:hypothetical protein